MIVFFPNLPPEIKENSNFETGTFRSRRCCTAFVLRPSLPHMASFFIDLATSKTISFFHLTILVNKQGFLVVTGKINHEISSTGQKKAGISNTDRTSSHQVQNCNQAYREGNRWGEGEIAKPAW
jgi:hypothetical protein